MITDFKARQDAGEPVAAPAAMPHPASRIGRLLRTGPCLLLVLAIFSIPCSCRRPPATLVTGGYDEQEMEAAIARARSEIDVFLAALENKQGTDFAVKAPVKDGDETEHFWLTEVVHQKGSFEGVIANEPGVVANVKFGQKWRVTKAELTDWMFLRDGKIHGNYTMRPLLKTMKQEEADSWRSRFADP